MKKKHVNARLICQVSAAAALVLAGNAMAADAFSSDSKWMTGDWGGERTKLIEQGIDIKADYVGEMGANLNGGYNDDKTARYADQFGLGVALDLQKLWGWDNTQAKIQLTNRNGYNISNDRVGDPREAIASILAEMDRAIGIAEEQAIAARPRRDAHRFDIAGRGRGNAARQLLPMLALVAAAEHGRAGIMRLAPKPRMPRRARHEERLLVGR